MPAAKPFCGAMLPTAICTGWPVNRTSRQPITLVNGQLFFSLPVSLPGSTSFTGFGWVVDSWPQATLAMHKQRTYTNFATPAPLPSRFPGVPAFAGLGCGFLNNWTHLARDRPLLLACPVFVGNFLFRLAQPMQHGRDFLNVFSGLAFGVQHGDVDAGPLGRGHRLLGRAQVHELHVNQP